MKKKIFKGLCVICLLVGGTLQFSSYELLKIIGSSMITSILVSLIWQYYFTSIDAEEMDKKLCEKIGEINLKIGKIIEENRIIVEKSVYNAYKKNNMLELIGLKYVSKNRSYLTDNIEIILNTANYSIEIMGESLHSFLDRPEFISTLENNLKRDIQIKILLLSLASDTLKERYEELELKLNESVGLHKHALREYYKISRKYINCEMKLFKYHPKLLLIIIDNETIYTQHYSPGMKGYEAPLYKYHGGSSGVVKYYCNVFTNLWCADSTVEATSERIGIEIENQNL